MRVILFGGKLGLQAKEVASQVALRDCSKKSGEEGYIDVSNKGGRWPEHQRLLLIKENQLSQTEEFCCYCLVAKSYLTVYNPMDCRTPGFPVLHCRPEFAQTHVH